jgi:glycerophosphoryl diester phosphodiesterase
MTSKNLHSIKKETCVIGHRGAMGHEMENTLASIQKAMDLKVDMVEIDVFKIKTGELVVFHDETIDRLTDQSGFIEDFTHHQLSQIKLTSGDSIPLLSEVISLVQGKIPINIELKGLETAETTWEVIQQSLNENITLQHFLISSFHFNELEKVRKLHPNIAIGVLTEQFSEEILAFAQKINAFSIHINHEVLDISTLQSIQNKGFKVYVFTVNEIKSIEKFKKMGVDGIFCNFPERMNHV